MLGAGHTVHAPEALPGLLKLDMEVVDGVLGAPGADPLLVQRVCGRLRRLRAWVRSGML